MNEERVFEIGLLARVTWNLHSLNNEGTVGNVVEPRTVVLADGAKVDGISGEMLKHVHTENVWLVANGSPLCEACKRLQPQKADMPDYRRIFRGMGNAEAMGRAITNCVLCDVHGFLMQEPAIARKSTVEFGWAVGLPDRVHRSTHVHARHAVGERGQESQAPREEEVRAQMVYHRPTRSGVYALVSLFQPWRVGLNEVDYRYVLSEEDRSSRYRLVLTAYRNMLRRADGAMTSTRLPHVEGVEGLVVYSIAFSPVPLISPLRDDFCEQIEELARRDGSLRVERFSNVAEACEVFDRLNSTRPLVLQSAVRA